MKRDIIAPDTLLKAMMQATEERIVVVNHEGYIEAISDAYADFLSVSTNNVIGRHVSEIIENTRLDVVAKTGIPEIGDMQAINGKNMVANRMPIMRDGNCVGAWGRVVFRNIDDVTELYQKMKATEDEFDFYKERFEKSNSAKYGLDDIIGSTKLIEEVKGRVKKSAKTNSTVLILGETGTGKELFANAIHKASVRAEKPFICVNCGSIPENLIESELFGYEEGAFTGAKKSGKLGMFQAASGGTIFLDEIGELSYSMQVKLLRVLQDKEVQKIGSNRAEPIDVKVIAATNRDLYKMVKEGKFREDLYYRLNVITLRIPPLRERKTDIPILCKYLLQKISHRENLPHYEISSEAMKCILQYDWPGNVRELENAIESTVNFIGEEQIIAPNHLPTRISGGVANFKNRAHKEYMEEMERKLILDTLMACKGNKTICAKTLELSRTALYEKMKKHNITDGYQ